MPKNPKVHKDRESYSGTIIYNGRIQSEEYVPELADQTTRIQKYDEMMRSNATVQETVQLLTMPILSAKWYVEPVSDAEQDIEPRDFADAVLMKNWPVFLEGALDMIPFGFVPFEVTWKEIEWNGQTKLAPVFNYIYPKTIYQWFIQGKDEKDPYIIQRLDNGNTSTIYLRNMLIFSFKKRGEDYTGNSVLRAAYPHWYRVQQFYKFTAIAGERQAMGIPYAKYPRSIAENSEKIAAIEEALANLRTNETGYIAYPDDYTVGIMDMNADKTYDFEPLINHQNIQIARAAMVGFMHIGTQANGSRAASYDQSTIYENSLESVASQIASLVNDQIMPKLIQYNFANVKEYPKVCYSGIKRDDITSFGDLVQKLVSSGAITMTPNTEAWIRAKISAPEREDVVDDQRPNEIEDEEDVDMEASEKSEKVKASMAMSGKNKSFYRPLTASEEKVNLVGLEKKIERDEERLRNSLTGLTDQQIDAIIAAILFALSSPEPLAALQTLRTDLVAEYGSKILENIRQSFEYAKMMTADEIEAVLGDNAAPVPKTTTEEIQKMQYKSQQVAQENATKLQNNAMSRVMELYQTGRNNEEIAAIVRQDMKEKQQKIIDATVAAMVIAAINQGRTFVQQTYVNKIQGYQYSAILDARTCNFCRALDKKVITKDDPAYRYLMPPQHFGCRCIWVEVLIDEKDKPQPTGIPPEINQDMGLSNFRNIDKQTLKEIQ